MSSPNSMLGATSGALTIGAVHSLDRRVHSTDFLPPEVLVSGTGSLPSDTIVQFASSLGCAFASLFKRSSTLAALAKLVRSWVQLSFAFLLSGNSNRSVFFAMHALKAH